MELLATILIYIHAFFGGIGLISGLLSILARKGSIRHRKSGNVFSFSMITSSLLSLVVARMPGHENLFLFLIGIFTIYLVLAGRSALKLKSNNEGKVHWSDKGVSGTMLLASVVMIGIGVNGMIQQVPNTMLFLFFGGFGLFMSWKDFVTFRTFQVNKHAWIISHIGRMVGALIASVTAFIVAGLNIGTIFAWMAPTVLGTVYIIYWSRKMRSNSPVPENKKTETKQYA